MIDQKVEKVLVGIGLSSRLFDTLSVLLYTSRKKETYPRIFGTGSILRESQINTANATHLLTKGILLKDGRNEYSFSPEFQKYFDNPEVPFHSVEVTRLSKSVNGKRLRGKAADVAKDVLRIIKRDIIGDNLTINPEGLENIAKEISTDHKTVCSAIYGLHRIGEIRANKLTRGRGFIVTLIGNHRVKSVSKDLPVDPAAPLPHSMSATGSMKIETIVEKVTREIDVIKAKIAALSDEVDKKLQFLNTLQKYS